MIGLGSEMYLAAVAVLVAGFIRGFSGFGAGMILVPVLSLLYSPVVAVVTVALLELTPAIQLLPGALSRCHWRSVVPMSLMASLAVPIGAMALINIDVEIMRVAIATLVLLSVFVMAIGWRYRGEDKQGHVAMITGFGSGLISGATSLGGLPVIFYYLSGTYTSSVARASMIVFLVFSTVIALITFLFHDIVTVKILGFTAWLLPLFIVATWAGGKMFGKVSEAMFRTATLTLLGGVGVLMMFGKT